MIALAGRGRTLYPILPTFSITLGLGCPGDRNGEQAFVEVEKKIQKEIRWWPWHRKALRRLESVTIWSYINQELPGQQSFLCTSGLRLTSYLLSTCCEHNQAIANVWDWKDARDLFLPSILVRGRHLWFYVLLEDKGLSLWFTLLFNCLALELSHSGNLQTSGLWKNGWVLSVALSCLLRGFFVQWKMLIQRLSIDLRAEMECLISARP